MSTDTIQWRAHAHVDVFTDSQVEAARTFLGHDPSGDELLELAEPVDVIDAEGNALLTAGLARITSLIIGGGGQALDNTHTRLGVGDGSTAVVVGDTDLSAASGSTHRYFMTMDATYPSVSNGVITLRATFATGVANFAWGEWGVDLSNSSASAGTTVNTPLVNRKVASLGTKTSAVAWVFTVTLTLA